MFQAERLRESLDHRLGEPDAGPAPSDADDRKTARLSRGDDPVRVLVVDVDDRGAAGFEESLEQPQLGGEISCEARVIVEMIAGDVGERAGGDAQAVEPVLVEPVRGCLDREMRHAFAGERVERTVQRHRIRRRE